MAPYNHRSPHAQSAHCSPVLEALVLQEILWNKQEAQTFPEFGGCIQDTKPFEGKG